MSFWATSSASGLWHWCRAASRSCAVLIASVAAIIALPAAAAANVEGQHTLHGVVSGGLGGPLEGASINIRGGGKNFSATTAHDGSYTVSVPTGTFSIEVGYRSPEARGTLQTGGEIEALSISEDRTEDFSLPLEGVVLAHVNDASEEPVAGAQICLTQANFHNETTTAQGTLVFYFGSGVHSCGLTDGGGNRTLYGFSEQPATTTTHRASEFPMTSEVTPTSAGTPLTIELPADLLTISGTVRDRGSSELPGSVVSVHDPQASVAVTTNDEGAYVVKAPAGTYRIDFDHTGPESHGKSEAEAEIADLVVGEDIVEDAVLPAEGGLIDAHVVDINDQSVPSAEVCIEQGFRERTSNPQGTPIEYFGDASQCGLSDEGGDLDVFAFLNQPATVSARRFRVLGEAPAVAEAVPTASGTPLTLRLEQPTVTKLSIKKGPASGGTSVTITGTNLGHATAVSFGAASAPDFHVISASAITAVAPPGTAEIADVRVTNPSGESPLTAKDHYTYGRPTVAALTPSAGPTAGGTSVTIRGSGFAPGLETTTFIFKKTAGVSVNCASTSECIVTAPAGKRGIADVVASVGKYKSKKTAADQFSYG